jgi:hypothetical protein
MDGRNTVPDAVDTRREAMSLAAWPDRQAAAIRIMDIASQLLADLGVGDLPYDQDSCDTMNVVANVLWLTVKEAQGAH